MLTGMSYDILNGNVIHNVCYSLVKLFPHVKCLALGSTFAGVHIVLKTNNGSKIALCQSEYHSNGVIFRGICKLISALRTSYALYKARSAEKNNYLFKIFYADILAFGYVTQRNGSSVIICRKGTHHTKCISALGRYFHNN